MIAGGPRGATVAARLAREVPRDTLVKITDKAMDAIVCKRMVAARQLSGLSQCEAAARLGYKNSTALSKIEAQKATAPRYIICRAAYVYSVSADYLMGLSDYPERDPRTVEQLAILRHLRKAITDHAAENLRTMIMLAGEQPALRAHLHGLIAKSGAAFQSFCRATSDGLEVPAGLLEAMDDLVNAGDDAQKWMRRQNSIRAGEADPRGRAVVEVDELLDVLDSPESPLLALIEGRSELELARDIDRAGVLEKAL